MKKFLAAVTLLILTAGTAQADMIEFTTPGASNEYQTRYTLDSFKIASDSLRLNGQGEVTHGTIEINEGTRFLRLTLNRHLVCPMGMACIQVMPAPTIVVLPIQIMKRDMCGTLSIVAERNLQLVDGGLTRVEIVDGNAGASACGGNADDITFVKRVKVLVTEKGLRDRAEALSVMSGFPFRN